MATSSPFLQSPFQALINQAREEQAQQPGSDPVVEVEAPKLEAAPEPVTEAAPAPIAAAPRKRSTKSTKPVSLAPPKELLPVFAATAEHFGVPENILMAIAQQESSYNNDAVNEDSGAKGMVQYIGATAKSLGINASDPNESIPAAAMQLRERMDKGMSLEDAVKEHFAGPDRKLWGSKTAAYGREVLDKAEAIGRELYGEGDIGNPTSEPAKQNAFAPDRMARAEYEANFKAMNPKAAPDALAAVMAQYDQQSTARTKVKGNAVQDKFTQLQSPEAMFDAKLNAKLQGKNKGVAQAAPARQQPVSVNPQEVRERPGVVDQAKSDFGRGIDNLKALGYGLGGLAADALGNDEAATSMLDEYVAIQDEVARTNPATIGTYKNVKSLGDAGRYAIEAVAENLPMLLPSLVSGGVGAQIGKKAAERIVGGMIEAQVAKGVAREVAEKQAAQFVAKRVMQGSVAGAAPASVGMESGSIMGDIYQETGKTNSGAALAGGIPAGVLDAIPAVMALRKIAGPVADQVAGGFLKRLGVEAGKQFFAEGGTEVAQTVIEEIAKAGAAGRDLSPELLDQVIDAALKGGIGGAVIGGASQGVNEARRAMAQPMPSRQPQNRIEPTMGEPAAPSGPLSSALNDAAATVQQDGDEWTAEVMGDDGLVHRVDSRTGVIMAEPPPAGPLESVINEVAEQHASDPAPLPVEPQAEPAPPDYSAMPLEALQTRLKEIGAQVHDDEARKALMPERKAIEKAVGAKIKEAKAASKPAEEPLTTGPFDDIKAANRMMIRHAEAKGAPYEVIESGGKFKVQPLKEQSDAVDSVSASGRVDGLGRSSGEVDGVGMPDSGGRAGTGVVSVAEHVRPAGKRGTDATSNRTAANGTADNDQALSRTALVDRDGKPLIVYHGSDKKLPAKMRSGEPIYVTTARGYADSFNPLREGETAEFTADIRNPYYATEQGEIDGFKYSKEVIAKLKAMGHDGAIYKGGKGPQQALVFDASQLTRVGEKAEAEADTRPKDNPYKGRQFSDPAKAEAFIDKNGVDRDAFEVVQVGTQQWKIQPSLPKSNATKPHKRKLYHGTRNEFDTFDIERSGGMVSFAENRNDARRYAMGAGGGRTSITPENSLIFNEDGYAYRIEGDNAVPVGTWEESDDLSAQSVSPLKDGDKPDSMTVERARKRVDDGFASVVPLSSRIIESEIDGANLIDTTTDEGIAVIAKMKPTNRLMQGLVESAKLDIQTGGRAQFNYNFWSSTKGAGSLGDQLKEGIVQALKDAGYDGIRFADDGHTTVGLFDNGLAKIGGKPSAAKPAKEKSSNVPEPAKVPEEASVASSEKSKAKAVRPAAKSKPAGKDAAPAKPDRLAARRALNDKQDDIVRKAQEAYDARKAAKVEPKPIQRHEVQIIKQKGERTVDVEKTTAALPPVAAGHVRLYRAESPTVKFDDVFDADGLKDFKEAKKGRPGVRYTPDLKYADYYRLSYGRDATIHYVDVPQEVAEQGKIDDDEYAIDTRGKVPELAPAEPVTEEAEGVRYSVSGSSKFSEDNRLSNLSPAGASWERIRAANPELAGVTSMDEEVTVYRATIGDTIRPDDYVALNRKTLAAELRNVRARDKGAKIITMKVRVRDLLMANDATEFVYYPAPRYSARDDIASTAAPEISPLIQKLADGGAVVVHADASTLPGKNVPDGVQALTEADGTIHLVASSLTDANARAVLLHEAFHAGGKSLVGSEQWNALMKRLGALYRQSEQSGGKARVFFDKARARVATAKAKGAVADGMEHEEFGAYAIEEYESAPLTLRKWVDDLVGAVKMWALRRFGRQLGQVTPAQLSALARLALMDVRASREQAAYSLTDKRTIEVDGVLRPIRDSEGNLVAQDFMAQMEFWRNFDGELDAEGRPILSDKPDARYSVAGAPQPRTLTPPEQGLLRRVQAQIQDSQNRVKQVQERIKAVLGIDTLGGADAYLAETNRPGRIAARKEDARDRLFEPMMRRLAEAGYKPVQLDQLLHAQHAKERNEAVAKINPQFPDAGSGLSTKKAQEIIDSYQGEPKLLALADEARSIARSTLEMKHAYGLMTQDQFDTLATSYDNYVPLKGDGEYGPKVKRAMGHDERDEHILENIARDYEQAIVVGEKNLARQSLVQMVLQFADDALWTARVPPKGRYVAGTVFNVKHKGTGDIEASYTAQSQVAAFLEAKGSEAAQYEVNTSGGEQVVEFTKPLQDNEVMVYIKGSPVRVQIFDEVLARQLRSLKGEQMNVVLEFMRGHNRWLSMVFTGYNPSFIIKNATRDAITGTINMTGNNGAITAAKAWARYPQAWATMLYWASTKKVPDSQMGRMLTEYRNQGGKVGASYMSDLEEQGKSLGRMFDDAKGVIGYAAEGRVLKASAVAGRKAIMGLAHMVEVLNQAFENALRLALFAQLRAEGKKPGIAAAAAKAVTVNFDRKGAMTPQLGAFYLFINPAIQGTANLTTTLVKGEHKMQAWALTGMMAAAGFAAAVHGMDDDKDRWLGEKWDTRTKNLRFRVGETTINIPLSQEYAPFYAMGVAMGEVSRGESSIRASVHTLSSFLDAYYPMQGAVQPGSDNPALDLLLSHIPTVGKMPAQVAANRNSFGSKVVPESETTKNRPDNLKMNRGTKGSVYDGAAQLLASGDKYENDLSKVSPETLKLIWGTYTGGLGRFVADTIGAGNLAHQADLDMDASDVPIVKDFVKPDNVNPIRSRFYDLSSEARKTIDQFAAAKKALDRDGMREIAAKPEAKLHLGLAKMVKSVNEVQAIYADTAVTINADAKLTTAEKRTRLAEIEAEQEAIYRKAIEAFSR